MEEKDQFYELLDNSISTLDNKKIPHHSGCLQQDLGFSSVKGTACSEGAGFKFWCNKHFKIEATGTNQILYCKKTSCPVTTKEDMYAMIRQCHQHVGHSQRDKTCDEVRQNYSWIRRGAVGFFLTTCSDCKVCLPVKKPQATKPITSLGFLTHAVLTS